MPASKYRKKTLSRVLHRLADPSAEFFDAIKPLGVSARPLLKLLRDPSFCKRLDNLLVTLQRQREIALQRASVHAATLLARQVAGKGTMNEARRRTCIELIRLARSSQAANPRSVHPGATPSTRAISNVGSSDVPQLSLETLNPNLDASAARELVQSLENS